SWKSFQHAFKEIEMIDITGIQRLFPQEPIIIKRMAFHKTLDMLIHELRKNAITYARYTADARTLQGTIREDFYTSETGYVYTIEDDNQGIARDNLRYIFDVCFSEIHDRDVSYTTFAGTGVGLAEVRNVVDMYDGSIEIISRTADHHAYRLYYKQGVFSDPEKTETGLHNPTGTKFLITIPFPVINVEKIVAPEQFRGDDNELPIQNFDPGYINDTVQDHVDTSL
ncbi:MAG: hypothetical protein GF384_03500, partial [Elusimicrobia bacterium]|nr:hypothetical protein [Elusimicrobiota bacterium]MBD3411979.1 hypothetical protein [Elusimicrobiota bacterium]